jgi:ubiquinone/menaquinone biosynthesis C-methylase UbiE
MIQRVYNWFHRISSRSGEKGEYSGGVWPNLVRRAARDLCLQTRGRVLEIGCGEGLFLIELAKVNPGLEIWGVDNSRERLEQAAVRCQAAGVNNVRLLKQEATEIAFSDGFFDAVLCINTLFNMDSLGTVARTLGEMKRVVTAGGKLIFDFRNALNLVVRIKYRLAPCYDPTVKLIHLKAYTPGQMAGVMRSLNLRPARKIALGFPWKMLAPVILVEARKDDTNSPSNR